MILTNAVHRLAFLAWLLPCASLAACGEEVDCPAGQVWDDESGTCAPEATDGRACTRSCTCGFQIGGATVDDGAPCTVLGDRCSAYVGECEDRSYTCTASGWDVRQEILNPPDC